MELLYRNQGAENSGWVNDGFVKAALEATPGLDVSRLLAARDGAAVTALAGSAVRKARVANVTGTPTFEIAHKGKVARRLEVDALDVPSFAAPIDRLLAR